MIWLQENWIIAVIVAVLALLIIGFILRRPKDDHADIIDDAAIATTARPAPPPKPLEPKKPEIIVAEPARFKPLEPAAPVAPAVSPMPAPVPLATKQSDLAQETEVASKATPDAAPTPAAVQPPVSDPLIETPSPASPDQQSEDNLRLIKGLGPKLTTSLKTLGITRFDQIAAWTDEDIARIDPQLGVFQGRILRDNWVDQASYLARRDKEGFEAKYGALGGEF